MAKFKASIQWEGLKKTGLYLSIVAIGLCPVLWYAISKNVPVEMSLSKDKTIKIDSPQEKTIEQMNGKPPNSVHNLLEENRELKNYINEKTIPIDRLPLELRGKPDVAIVNIENMYKQQKNFETSIKYSFMIIQSELERSGTINTEIPVYSQDTHEFIQAHTKISEFNWCIQWSFRWLTIVN